MRRKQHGPVLFGRGQQVPELAPRERVHASRGLVEQYKLGLTAERDGRGQLATHAAAQLVAAVVAALREVERREELVRFDVGVRVRGTCAVTDHSAGRPRISLRCSGTRSLHAAHES